MDVERAYPHVWVEGFFVEQDRAASMVGDVPRLGPGFQVKILMRTCSSSRLGLLVSNLQSDGEERHVLMKASRNTGAALPLSFMWRARMVVGSAVTHTVLSSRMDEVSSSKSVRISMSERGESGHCGVEPY